MYGKNLRRAENVPEEGGSKTPFFGGRMSFVGYSPPLAAKI